MANNRRPLSTPKDAPTPVSEQPKVNPFAPESLRDAPVKQAAVAEEKAKKLNPQEEANAARKHSEGE